MARSTPRLVVAVLCTLAVAAAPATAVEQLPAGPTACAPGSDVYKVTKGKRTHKLTHVNRVKVGPKKTRTVTKPALVVRSVSARVIGADSFDPPAVLVAAHRRYLKNEDSVRVPGDATSKEPVDLGKATLRNPTAVERQYAGFSAAIVWRGKWTRQECGESEVLARGSWRTFSAVTVSGYALCPASRYDRASAAAQACRQVWN